MRGLCALITAALAVAAVQAPMAAARPKARTLVEVKRCLRSAHLRDGAVKRDTTFLDTIRPRPLSLVNAGSLALIAIYRRTADAVSVFSRANTTFPLVQHANALIISLITPQPSRAQLRHLEVCAFGEYRHKQTGPLVRPQP